MYLPIKLRKLRTSCFVFWKLILIKLMPIINFIWDLFLVLYYIPYVCSSQLQKKSFRLRHNLILTVLNLKSEWYQRFTSCHRGGGSSHDGCTLGNLHYFGARPDLHRTVHRVSGEHPTSHARLYLLSFRILWILFWQGMASTFLFYLVSLLYMYW